MPDGINLSDSNTAKRGQRCAEDRLYRIRAVLRAIYCVANGDEFAGDDGNHETISALSGIARDELDRVLAGLDVTALNSDCGF